MADYKNTDDLIKNLEKEYELNEKTKKEIREFISLLKEKKNYFVINSTFFIFFGITK
jgi:hypothetical protein